ncbi:hypothetical protein OH723_24285 [Streptomyces albidoflavus]|uniref:hypothetical protein n=1 Tax=Streptomyces albidoflavus TaxID=1886 RepID=UPI00386DA112|nr:hypothetical protein OH723_24285 [Streptomyces albidoflavus]
MAQFKAGDKVRWGALTGVVRFGPYTSELGNQDRYMVESADSGRCCSVSGSALTPWALEIGDRVTVADMPGTFTLAAGPWQFPSEAVGPHYVVTDAEGYAYVAASILVHAAAAPEADKPCAWRDRQGDIWYPLGEAEGEQRYGMDFGAVPNAYTSTLEAVRTDWGPLEAIRTIQEPTAEGATAIDASGDVWYRHGTGSDGVGRWSMRPLGSGVRALDMLSTWQRIVSDYGPMRAAQ